MISLLRWSVGISSALALALLILVLTIGKGLGSAYQSGASREDVFRATAPLALTILLGGMLASAFFPNSRAFLHVIAACVIVAVAGCTTLLRSNAGEAMLYIAFFAVWLCYYAALMMIRE